MSDDLKARALGRLRTAAAKLRGGLAQHTLTPLAEAGWQLVPETQFNPEHVFLSAAWFKLKGFSEGRLTLAYPGPEAPLAWLVVRDHWLPGLSRRWELLTEPAVRDVAPTQYRLLADLFALARHNGVDAISCSFNMARFTDPELPRRLSPEALEAFGTYVVDLQQPTETVLAGLHAKHRHQLKKAEQAGITVRFDAAPEVFLPMLEATYARGGKRQPFDRTYLAGLLAADCPLPRLVASAWLADQCQAILVVPYDRRRAYFLHGATIDRPANGSAVIAHVALMRALQERGVATYDLGGARRETDDPRLEGIFRFKRRFGGAFEDCVRFQQPLATAPKALGDR